MKFRDFIESKEGDIPYRHQQAYGLNPWTQKEPEDAINPFTQAAYATFKAFQAKVLKAIGAEGWKPLLPGKSATQALKDIRYAISPRGVFFTMNIPQATVVQNSGNLIAPAIPLIQAEIQQRLQTAQRNYQQQCQTSSPKCPALLDELQRMQKYSNELNWEAASLDKNTVSNQNGVQVKVFVPFKQ